MSKEGKIALIIIAFAILILVVDNTGILESQSVQVNRITKTASLNDAEDFWSIQVLIDQADQIYAVTTDKESQDVAASGKVAQIQRVLEFDIWPKTPYREVRLKQIDFDPDTSELNILEQIGTLIGKERITIPAYTQSGNWKKTTPYTIEIKKQSSAMGFSMSSIAKESLEVSPSSDIHTFFEIDGDPRAVDVKNLGQISKGFEVPTTDVIVIQDGAGIWHIFNRDNFEREGDVYFSIHSINPTIPGYWSHILEKVEDEFFYDDKAKTEMLINWAYSAPLSGWSGAYPLGLKQEFYGESALIVIDFSTDLADTIYVEKGGETPQILSAALSATEIDGKDSFTLNTVIKNAGSTKGTIKVSVRSGNELATINLDSQEATLDKGVSKEFTFNIQAPNLNGKDCLTVVAESIRTGDKDFWTDGLCYEVTATSTPTPTPGVSQPTENNQPGFWDWLTQAFWLGFVAKYWYLIVLALLVLGGIIALRIVI